MEGWERGWAEIGWGTSGCGCWTLSHSKPKTLIEAALIIQTPSQTQIFPTHIPIPFLTTVLTPALTSSDLCSNPTSFYCIPSPTIY